MLEICLPIGNYGRKDDDLHGAQIIMVAITWNDIIVEEDTDNTEIGLQSDRFCLPPETELFYNGGKICFLIRESMVIESFTVK